DELWISPHSSIEDYPKFCEAMDTVLEVWCSESEWKAAENDGLIAVPDEMKADADSSDTEISDAESEDNESDNVSEETESDIESEETESDTESEDAGSSVTESEKSESEEKTEIEDKPSEI
ncbi:MAG: hypothetical protein J5703_06710, partial [Methanomicrobium sp.]|nr:hypothetical protein [Methanomicrobium sp.]